MSSLTVPPYVQAANIVSSSLFSFFGARMSLAAGLGATMGKFAGKPWTYALYSTLSDFFWKCIHPYTVEKVFMHKQSNLSARVIGTALSYLASVTIPYYLFSKLILPSIKDSMPYLKHLKTENQGALFTLPNAFYASIAPALIATLTAMMFTQRQAS